MYFSAYNPDIDIAYDGDFQCFPWSHRETFVRNDESFHEFCTALEEWADLEPWKVYHSTKNKKVRDSIESFLTGEDEMEKRAAKSMLRECYPKKRKAPLP